MWREFLHVFSSNKRRRGVSSPVPEPILGRSDPRPRSCQLGTKAQQPLFPLLSARRDASRGFHDSSGTRSLPAPASHESRQQPFGRPRQCLGGWSSALAVSERFVLVPTPVAARFSRELQHSSGVVHRGGEPIALKDHARKDLVRACTHRGSEQGGFQRVYTAVPVVVCRASVTQPSDRQIEGADRAKQGVKGVGPVSVQHNDAAVLPFLTQMIATAVPTRQAACRCPHDRGELGCI